MNQIYACLGIPNDSIRLENALEDATTGSVTIAGRDVSDLASSEREMAMVFQNHALFPHMTVRENTQFPLKMTNASAPDMSRSVNAAAELLRISELLDREPSELSGGERQRVAVGRAIVEEPKVFLFDEPLSNLDAELRVKMCGQIAKLHRSLSNTMIYVTHDQTEALAMADRIVVLRDGEIVQTGTPHDLYYQPASQFVAGLIGSPQMNFLDCELVSHHEETSMIRTASSESARLPVGPCDISPGTKLVLGVRPEHVLLEEKGDDVIAIDVVIDIVEHLGPMCLVHCQHIDGSGFAFQAPESISVNVGDRKRVWVEGASTYLFSPDGGALTRYGLPSP